MAKKQTQTEHAPLRPGNPLRAKNEINAKLDERIDAGKNILQRQISNETELDQLEADARTWSHYNEELLLDLFDNEYFSNDYKRVIVSFSMYGDGAQRISDWRNYIQKHIHQLESIIARLQLRPEPVMKKNDAEESIERPKGRKVFIVHGHDDGIRKSVELFLKNLDLDPIILNEQPNGGKTVLEKFEMHADSVDFAVVLLTPDDMGSAKDVQPLKPRARQNVIFELGYFFGRLKRHNVAALYIDGVEQPSDIHGLVYIKLDQAGAWRSILAKELREAGLEINLEGILK